MKLTEKQQMFVDEYIIDLNATQAAIRAGYSEKCARQAGNANMSKVYIQQAIQARSAEKKDNLVMKQDEILERNMSSWRNVMKRHLKSVVIMIKKCLK
ncbi:terminase small subunit [Staphylococcus pseudintermedius]|nr:terminase small subunit [Staphylococcus pseudintermedius]EJA1886308.1 terminase small subunit [Staphylococcus pseudintermedius]